MIIGKRESQRLEKRAQIIAIARQHFFEYGFDNTTMSAIAAQLGGSKRTLWSYFNDKDELFDAMLADTAAGIRSQIEWPSEEGEPLERITKLCRTVIDRALSPIVIAMFRLISGIADRRPDLGHLFFQRGPGETQRLVGEYLREHFSDILWTTDYKAAGVDLVAFSSSEMHFERSLGLSAPPTPKQRDDQAYRAAMLFLRAYGRDPDKLVPREQLADMPAGRIHTVAEAAGAK